MSEFILGVLAVILFLLSLFLIFIIMIQRGKGGGIAGSLTGTAQSAFGARGGDLLMWWTIGLTGVWISLSGITIFFYSSPMDEAQAEVGGATTQSDGDDNSQAIGAVDNLSINDTDAIIEAVDEAAAAEETDADVDANDANSSTIGNEPDVNNQNTDSNKNEAKPDAASADKADSAIPDTTADDSSE
ncbi:MAG: preprotein translocase subunit SecG [Planctomycetaceae bacterium]|nr:preprotein translocase subunit SecG [Planctomycetaceae bacterium]